MAAVQVFEEHGYAGTTTNRVAARAGVSVGTLYQYFPNKEALAVALLERHLAETRRRVNDWAGATLARPRDLRHALQTYVEAMLEMHGGRPRLQHLLLEETPLPPRLNEAVERNEEEAARTVAGLLRTCPEAARSNLERAARLVVQSVEALTHRFAAHPEQGLSREEFSEELVAMLEGYLRGPPRDRAGPQGGRRSSGRRR